MPSFWRICVASTVIPPYYWAPRPAIFATIAQLRGKTAISRALPAPERDFSAFLQGDAQAGSVHIEENGLQGGVGGHRIHVARVGGWRGHVVGHDQAPDAHQGAEPAQVVE